jgi:glycosyltransferase involved in cell wall biosynthesis
MRILLLSFNWVEYLIEMANALVERGHEVEVGFKTERVAQTVGNEHDALLDRRVRYHLLDDSPAGLRDPRQLVTIANVMRLLGGKRDVVHLHDAGTTFLPFCLRTACRTPIVLTIHDVTPHPGADSEQPARRERVRGYLRSHAAAVILHGQRLEEQYLAANGARCRNTHVIPHGCYTVFRHWADPHVEEIPSSALFFGRIQKYKGLDTLLKAAEIVARDIPSFNILIAGAGPDLERRRDELARNPHCVVRSGYLSNEEVARAFQQSSVVVLPYTEGSQSGVVRIAYVFGKPVIVTDVGSLAESVQPGVTGLVIPPGDEQALARAIVELLRDEQRRKAMSAAAARVPSEDLSWDTIARRTEEVYRAVVRS